MKLTPDESRALTFVAGLLLLSAAAHLAAVPEPGGAPAGGFDLQAHIEATRAAVAEAERASRPLAPGERLDPNTATATELARLPRVGSALAARIVADRERHGPFRGADDLARVRGIGPAMVEALQPHLAFDPAALPPVGPRVIRGGGAAGSARGGDAGRAGPVLELNTADAAALAGLPGIGPVLAARIVAYRDSAGPFPDVDALQGVKGIGPATLERLRPRLRAGGG